MAWYRNKALGYMVKMLLASLAGVSLIVLAKATIIDGCTSSSCSILLPKISDKTDKEIEDIAREITVRITAPGSVQSLIGSGTIIRDGSSDNYTYRVITNSHVLNSLKGMNDKAFETYNKNMQTMLAGLEKDYTQKDIDEYDAAISISYYSVEK